MYQYEWDRETGGYILNGKLAEAYKEVRPVFYQELDLLGFDKYWRYPKVEVPLLWAESRKYFYKGELVAKTKGGGLFTKPHIDILKENLTLVPVNTSLMLEKNLSLMRGLIQKTLQLIYDTYLEYKSKNIIYVAFSGGKDSLVLLDLVQRALPHTEFKVVFSDTTMEISATYEAIEKAKEHWLDLEFYTAKSHLDAKETWELFGPPSRTKRWCCSVHKTVPALLKLQEIYGNNKIKALVFDGVRAEESKSRSNYEILSNGKKHSTQVNCSPILYWNSAEIYLYLLEQKLFLNNAYKHGVTRVGCALCPLSSKWWDYIANSKFEETNFFIDIIRKNNYDKFKDLKELDKFLDSGGWKGRMGGRNLLNGGNRVVEQLSDEYLILNINEQKSNWKEWIKAIGEVVQISDAKYSIEHRGHSYIFKVSDRSGKLNVKIQNRFNNRDAIRFRYLFKNVFYKTAYCVNCRNCQIECPTGALSMTEEGVHIDKECIHCEACLDLDKGCLVANSLSVTTGGKNMNLKGINRYNHFGFRKIWLNYFLESKDDFWQSGKLGKYQFDGFRVWLKEAELTSNNMINDLSNKISFLRIEDIRVWAIIIINLSYNSPIINWYVKTIDFGVSYHPDNIVDLLGDGLSISTRKNAVTSLKETFNHSPIGEELGFGLCEMKGRSVVSITRTGWRDPAPLIILYSLYKFAEKSDGYYSFALSYLCNNEIERTGISPTQIFGIDRTMMKDKLQNLATDYKDFITVSFSKDLDNIDLNKNKNSLDIVELF